MEEAAQEANAGIARLRCCRPAPPGLWQTSVCCGVVAAAPQPHAALSLPSLQPESWGLWWRKKGGATYSPWHRVPVLSHPRPSLVAHTPLPSPPASLLQPLFGICSFHPRFLGNLSRSQFHIRASSPLTQPLQPAPAPPALMGPETLLTPSDIDLPDPNFHRGQARGSALCWKGAFICPSHTWIPRGQEKPHPAVGAATWPCSRGDKTHPAWCWSERVTGPLNAGLLSPCLPCTSYRAAWDALLWFFSVMDSVSTSRGYQSPPDQCVS